MRSSTTCSGLGRPAEDAVDLVRQAASGVARRNSRAAIREIAEDIGQDAVLAFVAIGPERIPADPAAWGAVVARNRIVDLIRRERRMRVVDWQAVAGTELEGIVERLRPSPDPATVAADRVDASRLLTGLTSRERQLLALVSEGRGHAEIATLLGYANARTVTATLHRVRRTLRGELPASVRQPGPSQSPPHGQLERAPLARAPLSAAA